MTHVHIGCAAGFAGDRFDASEPLIDQLSRHAGPRYLVFEVLAERTLALAQQQMKTDPSLGYSPFLEAYLRPALKSALEHQVTIVTNMGAANPVGAARKIHLLAEELSLPKPKISTVSGDNLLEHYAREELANFPTIEELAFRPHDLIAANAYLGARGIAHALEVKPDIVLVGRTTDSALVLGPLIHEFGWGETDWNLLAAGTICGHLLECGSQLTGGYFADPGYKAVVGLDRTGFPIAEVAPDGTVVITKPEGTGGAVTVPIVTEQLLYEMHDPEAYLVPDVVCDVSQIALRQIGPDQVSVTGVKGRPKPLNYKATVCQNAGWLGEAELSYAGPNALRRAELAVEICTKRLEHKNLMADARIEILGTNALFTGRNTTRKNDLPADGEFRIRAAILSEKKHDAQAVIDEVLSLYCSGPAGGGGFRSQITPQTDTASIMIAREWVEKHITVTEVGA